MKMSGNSMGRGEEQIIEFYYKTIFVEFLGHNLATFLNANALNLLNLL